MQEQKKHALGLVLSGGGAWGFAHIGLLRALDEFGLSPGIISGTSMGALIGALYADGYSWNDMLQVAARIKYFHFAGIHLPNRGLLEMTWTEKLLKSVLRAKTFDALQKQLVVTAVNLTRGTVVHFRSGTLIDKIIASASVPVIFKPVEIDGEDYVDGGLLDNFPVLTLRDACEKVIGMQVMQAAENVKLNNLLHIAERAFFLSLNIQSHEQAAFCDVFIEAPSMRHSIFDVVDAPKIAATGYNVARSALEQALQAGTL
jgi:NTE family protein